ncbi:MAG: NADPH:quinone oxidoreductase family protein [Gammaproteobacteria bacterium]|nr:NADPH:quinone oxidoreductase family protein [Gammaproteobacteria bacterium]TVQ48797.1 MAG: NADPH:quinone oxidoreductase family protein [Gammaproteobacteria bacterium]
MRAMLCHQHGGVERLEAGELPDPMPADGEVVIEIRACGLNFPDVLMIAGKYQNQPPLPFAPGAEVAGVVKACGPDVDSLSPGQRVLAYCGHGGLAEQVAVPAAQVLPIPDRMPFAEAAAFLLTFGTSWHALKQRAALRADETLLVLGAAGGVGLAAVELGKLLGARVLAVASSEEKRALAAAHGADEVRDYADLRTSIAEFTAGRGIDVVFDPVGGPLFEQALRSCAWNGRALVIGFAGGEIPQVPMNLPLLKGASIVGVFWGSFVAREPEVARENHLELLDHYAAGRLQVHVGATYPLAQAAEALALLAGRGALGKVVVTP